VKRFLVLGALAGCGHAAPPERSAVEQLFSDDPVAQLGGLEQRLTTARMITMRVRSGERVGMTVIRRDGESRIQVGGSRWRSTAPFDPDDRDVQPGDWADALALGAVRLGVTPDWARVLQKVDPETGNGDFDSYAAVDGVRWKDGDASTRTLTFHVLEAGAVPHDVTLTLDDRGLPAERDDGVTRETYLSFDLSK
jgi:hypothetical protein